MMVVILNMIALFMIAVVIAIVEVWIVSIFGRPHFKRRRRNRHG